MEPGPQTTLLMPARWKLPASVAKDTSPAPPPRTPRTGMSGDVFFNLTGCDKCHTRQFTTADDPSLEDALRNRIGGYGAWGPDKPPMQSRSRRAAAYEREYARLLWPW